MTTFRTEESSISTARPTTLTMAQNARKNQRASVWSVFLYNPASIIGLIGLTIIVLLTAFAGTIAPYDPLELNYRVPLDAPSGEHLFGTDDLGRDTFSRMLWGGRYTLLTAMLATAITVVGGIVLGIVSGYLGGWVDEIIQRLTEVVLVFPDILLLLSIIAVLEPNLTTITIAIGISGIPGFGRVIRGVVIGTSQNDYINAAKSLGAGPTHIMVKHVLPNILPLVILYATLGAAGAILLTSGLSYLGLGAQPPTPEWGAMLEEGRMFLHTAWWMSIFPGVFITLTALCINMVGEGLRKALDPRRYL